MLLLQLSSQLLLLPVTRHRGQCHHHRRHRRRRRQKQRWEPFWKCELLACSHPFLRVSQQRREMLKLGTRSTNINRFGKDVICIDSFGKNLNVPFYSIPRKIVINHFCPNWHRHDFVNHPWANLGLFLALFRSFQAIFYRKSVEMSGIRTRIITIEGEYADHHSPKTSIATISYLHHFQDKSAPLQIL